MADTETPIADWLREHWTTGMFLRDQIMSRRGGKTRYCVMGAITRLPAETDVKCPCLPITSDLVNALTHWNNRHSRDAAIEAVATYERTGIMPVCPDQEQYTWRSGDSSPVYETHEEYGMCPSRDALPAAATHQEGE